jgi:dCTP diphosphatase
MRNDHQALQQALREFAAERDWDQFHSPKNLAMALAAESGELLEQFQWLSEAQSRDLPPERRHAVSEELADVFLYLLRISDLLQVDLIESANAKLRQNASKYPVALARGNSKKYNEF